MLHYHRSLFAREGQVVAEGTHLLFLSATRVQVIGTASIRSKAEVHETLI